VAIKRDMARIANSASTVLITGETGTGKELAAEFIHARSARRTKTIRSALTAPPYRRAYSKANSSDMLKAPLQAQISIATAC